MTEFTEVKSVIFHENSHKITYVKTMINFLGV